MVIGHATAIRDDAPKRAALRVVVEHLIPGRADDVRGPSEAELAATEVVELAVTEASAKVRTGPPVDAPEDYALPTWAGVLPFALRAGAPVADPRCAAELPGYLCSYHRGDCVSVPE